MPYKNKNNNKEPNTNASNQHNPVPTSYSKDAQSGNFVAQHTKRQDFGRLALMVICSLY